MTFKVDQEGWNSNYVLQFYETKGSIENLSIAGGDAAILVNGSDVTLNGTVDVSGNEFGGIEVSQGEGVTKEPKLTVNGTLTFTTDEDLPAIWIDGKTSNDDWIVGKGIEGLYTKKIEDENKEQLWFDIAPAEGNATATAKLQQIGGVDPFYGNVSVNLTLAEDEDYTYDDIESLKIELYHDDKLLATNTLQPEKLNDTEKGKNVITSPFLVGRAEENSDYAWIRGAYKINAEKPTADELPNKVVSTYTIDGTTYVAESVVNVPVPTAGD